jgi:hypothetical protein
MTDREPIHDQSEWLDLRALQKYVCAFRSQGEETVMQALWFCSF